MSSGSDSAAGGGRADARAGVEVALERADPYWPAQAAVAAALILYVLLPDKLTLGPEWLVPSAEGLLLAGLILNTPRGGRAEGTRRRLVATVLLACVTIVNLVSLGLLVHFIVASGRAHGYELMLSGAQIWGTNVLIFAVCYWELDRGGPGARRVWRAAKPDFLFPQDTLPRGERWRPAFVDYLYTSFTNATAFSPTDTMPLSASSKLLMLLQAFTALVTVGLVVARAINAFG
jgi:uncharacterized membrane protein